MRDLTHISSPFHTSTTLIFSPEADRLEAGGFNLLMEIKNLRISFQHF